MTSYGAMCARAAAAARVRRTPDSAVPRPTPRRAAIFSDLTLAATNASAVTKLSVGYGATGASQSSFFGSSMYGSAGPTAPVYVTLAACLQGQKPSSLGCSCVDSARPLHPRRPRMRRGGRTAATSAPRLRCGDGPAQRNVRVLVRLLPDALHARAVQQGEQHLRLLGQVGVRRLSSRRRLPRRVRRRRQCPRRRRPASARAAPPLAGR